MVERHGQQYFLTESGLDLEPIVFGLGAWGARWAFDEPSAEELDAEILIWWIHTRLDTSTFPGRRQVFHFRFTDDPRVYWIVVESGEPSVCTTDPGYDVDVTVDSDVASLYQVWLGRLPLKLALKSGRVEFSGAATATRRMPGVLRLSPVAAVVAAARSTP